MGVAEGIIMVRQFHDMKVYYCACLVFWHSVPDFKTKVFFIINYQPFAKAELSLSACVYKSGFDGGDFDSCSSKP